MLSPRIMTSFMHIKYDPDVKSKGGGVKMAITAVMKKVENHFLACITMISSSMKKSVDYIHKIFRLIIIYQRSRS